MTGLSGFLSASLASPQELPRQLANAGIKRVVDLLLAPQGHGHLPKRRDQLHLELMLLERVGPRSRKSTP